MNQKYLVDINCQLHAVLTTLKTVTHMIEEKKPCSQILCQIGTVQHSLWNIRSNMISSQIRESSLVILNTPDVNIRQRELSRLLDLYKENKQTSFLIMR
jgi:DNA-binding FrmR family transcriptional regulator